MKITNVIKMTSGVFILSTTVNNRTTKVETNNS
jgi:hypothetical protein